MQQCAYTCVNDIDNKLKTGSFFPEKEQLVRYQRLRSRYYRGYTCDRQFLKSINELRELI